MTDKHKTDDAAEIDGEPIVGHTQEEMNHGIRGDCRYGRLLARRCREDRPRNHAVSWN